MTAADELHARAIRCFSLRTALQRRIREDSRRVAVLEIEIMRIDAELRLDAPPAAAELTAEVFMKLDDHRTAL